MSEKCPDCKSVDLSLLVFCPMCAREFPNRTAAALHSAEREVLEACVEEARALSVDTSYTPTSELDAAYRRIDNAAEARIAAVRRYRALLDGKEAK